MPELTNNLSKQLENELQDYFTRQVQISPDHLFSQSKLVRRISLFENKIYPKGKFDKQGKYKFWYDIITSRIESEVKNLDWDSKELLLESERKIDELPIIITNLSLKEYERESGQAEEANSAIEEFSGWGNVVWKKVKGGYERVDLKNFFVINQTAKTLEETPIIERYHFSQSDLRAKIDIWDNVEEIIKGGSQDSYAPTPETQGKETTFPKYEIYERNGEVCLYDLKDYQKKNPTEKDRKKYVLAKVIGLAKEGTGPNPTPKLTHILFAEEINKIGYKEAHRGAYKGRWFREGLYELLFDLQVRANQIGNQLSRGLEYASTLLLSGADRLVIQNALNDLKSGDYIKAADLKQVDLRMHAADQLLADWNRNLQLANEIANSREVVQGENAPGQPFRLGALLNQNANKLFDFLREKLTIPISEIYEEWIIPDLVKKLKAKEILRLTGDSSMMERLYELIVNSWYLDNLIAIGPHDSGMAEVLKQEKIAELKKRPELMMNALEDVWKGFKPNVSVVITGENSRLPEDLQTLATFIGLEADPVRRSALIEIAMKKKGIDVVSLPKGQQQPIPATAPSAPAGGAITL